MRIGKVAKQAGITVEAIRFYEKQGLVRPPKRDGSGYRNYPKDTIQHVSFIKRAKELGFSLKEIKELISLISARETSCGEVKKQAEDKIADIDRKVVDLQRMKKSLAELVSICPGQGPLSECPILGSINSKGKKI